MKLFLLQSRSDYTNKTADDTINGITDKYCWEKIGERLKPVKILATFQFVIMATDRLKRGIFDHFLMKFIDTCIKRHMLRNIIYIHKKRIKRRRKKARYNYDTDNTLIDISKQLFL